MEIVCLRFESAPKNSFVGTLDLYLPEVGIEIHKCTLWHKNGKKWVNVPQRSFVDKDLRRIYEPYVIFTKPELVKTFTESALKAVDKYCSETHNASK